VLTDQVRVLDVQSITGSLGRLSSEELQVLDDALAVVFGLRI
jgi:mRNA-degrading endonuclease toxin of MazEF toxin-antitoxin module